MSNTDFDPDAFLKAPVPVATPPTAPTSAPADTGFDPDKVLATPAPASTGAGNGFDPDAFLATTTPSTPHQNIQAIKKGMAAESLETPAGWGTPDTKQVPYDHASNDELIQQWKDVAKGLPQGLAAAITGGIAGDTEGAIRFLLRPYGASQQTILPTSVEGGPVLGQRGLGLPVNVRGLGEKGFDVIPPASSPEEAGARQIGSMLIPFMPKWLGALHGAEDIKAPPAALPEAPKISTPRTDPQGRPVSPDLLPPDTPHELPAGAPAGAQTISPLQDVSPEAVLEVNNSLQEAGFTPHTLEQRLQEMSPHEFGFEVGGPDAAPFRSANGIIQSGGQGGMDVAQALRQRGIEAPQRLNAMLDNAFGANEDLATLSRVERIDQLKAADPLYKQFESLRIQPTQAIKDLIPRLQAAGAFGKARQFAALDNKPWNQSFFTTGAQKEFPTAESWQLVKEALDSKIEDSIGPLGRATKLTAKLMDIRGKLLDAIDNHPDPNVAGVWRQARDTYAGPEAIRNAREFGKKLLNENVSADEVPYVTAGYSQPQMAALRQSVRNTLAQQAGRPGNPTPLLVKKLLGENNQAKIRWVLDNDPKADELFKGLAHERDMANAPRAPLYGSPTARNTVDLERWQAKPSLLRTGIGTAGRLISHPVSTLMGHGMEQGEAYLNKLADNRMAKIRDDAAKIYTMQGPQRDAVFQWILDHGADYARQKSMYASRPELGADVQPPQSFTNLQDLPRKRKAGGGAVRGEQTFTSLSGADPATAFSGSAFARGGRVSAKNINHNPSDAQKRAGNYAKDHVTIHGLNITIENAKGSKRSGTGKDGKAWESTLPAHYGYFKRSEGGDGDNLDVYLGPHTKSNKVWVIDQIDHESKKFDEHKVLLGFGAKQQAINTYRKAFSDGKGLHRIGAIHEMTIDNFKKWLKDGNTKAPVLGHKIDRSAFHYQVPHPPHPEKRCEWCRYMSGETTKGCGLYRMASQRMPEDCALDPDVKPKAFCDAFVKAD